MSEKPTAITSGEGEYFLHVYLWNAVCHQLNEAETAHPGSAFDNLAAMILAFNTLEAYLNFVGERLAPDIWRDERNYFSKTEPRGLGGKIKTVYEICGLSEPSKSDVPYSTVWEAKRFRDLIAHAKTEKEEYEVEHPLDAERPQWVPNIEKLVTHERAKRFADDISTVIETLHEAARKRKPGDIAFGVKALEGFLGYSSGTTRVKA